MAITAKPTPSWRDTLPIHPAANLFPLLPADELRTLGEDIIKNGLTLPIALWRAHPKGPAQLLDGRNRLDAIELVTGMTVEVGSPSLMAGEDFHGFHKVRELDCTVDPYAYVISANIHRRHLTGEQKRDLIAKVLEADPNKSDREIGRMIKADNKTVASVRAEKEAREEIPHVKTRTDSKGRKQPARKPATAFAAEPRPAATALSRNHANASEIKRLRARVEELQAENRHLEIENGGLRSEIEKL
jgi:hypothetical protein